MFPVCTIYPMDIQYILQIHRLISNFFRSVPAKKTLGKQLSLMARRHIYTIYICIYWRHVFGIFFGMVTAQGPIWSKAYACIMLVHVVCNEMWRDTRAYISVKFCIILQPLYSPNQFEHNPPHEPPWLMMIDKSWIWVVPNEKVQAKLHVTMSTLAIAYATTFKQSLRTAHEPSISNSCIFLFGAVIFWKCVRNRC